MIPATFSDSMPATQALIQDTTGLCHSEQLLITRISETEFEVFGTYPRTFRIAGEFIIRGWGDLDGPAHILESESAAWSILLPLAAI